MPEVQETPPGVRISGTLWGARAWASVEHQGTKGYRQGSGDWGPSEGPRRLSPPVGTHLKYIRSKVMWITLRLPVATEYCCLKEEAEYD